MKNTLFRKHSLSFKILNWIMFAKLKSSKWVDCGGFIFNNYTNLHFLKFGILRWASFFGPTPSIGEKVWNCVTEIYPQQLEYKT